MLIFHAVTVTRSTVDMSTALLDTNLTIFLQHTSDLQHRRPWICSLPHLVSWLCTGNRSRSVISVPPGTRDDGSFSQNRSPLVVSPLVVTHHFELAMLSPLHHPSSQDRNLNFLPRSCHLHCHPSFRCVQEREICGLSPPQTTRWPVARPRPCFHCMFRPPGQK